MLETLPDQRRERLVADHDDTVAVAQDVHRELGRVAVRHLQLIAPIVEPARLLLRMPLFARDPLRRLGVEMQRRPLDPGAATVDAIAGVELALELLDGNAA